MSLFFIISKILDFLIEPLVWLIVLLVVSLLSKNPKRKRRFLLTAIVLLVVFSNSFLLDEAMRAWETPATKISALTGTYDAGIVLSGMVTYDNSFDRIQFNRRNDRLMQAISLYKMKKIKKIVFSGGSGSLVYTYLKESEMVKKFLVEIGIPAEDIIIENKSNNTRENAIFTKDILQHEFPNGKFLLFTSAFHMRRAVACFKKAGIEVTPYSTDRYSGPRKYYPDHLLVPNAGTLFDWNSLLHEIIGYGIYKIMGYA
jgi:uncharacterized SAM-binding protein YcdF (DUF218 family)